MKSGDHCGIMCKGLDKDDEIRKGMWLGTPHTINTTNFMKAEFYLMSKEEGGREKGIQTGFADMIYCGVWNQPAKFFFNVRSRLYCAGFFCLPKIKSSSNINLLCFS